MLYANSLQDICHIDRIVIPWKGEPSPLVSLLDMIEFYAKEFCNFMGELETMLEQGLFNPSASDSINESIKKLDEIIKEALKWCKRLELTTASQVIDQIYEDTLVAGWWGREPEPGELSESLWLFRKIVRKELSKRLFMYIPLDQAEWYEKKDSFGKLVSDAFPSAIEDIKEAGTCYATGRYTACVFHLMRVAEIGLRALIWDRRIKFKKDTPIELKELRELFQGLEQAEKDIQSYPETKARKAQFEFYHGAMVQLRAFMHLYRHRTMHAREFYSQYRAKEAMESVSKFMEILARKISETKRTPLIWKKA